MRELKTYIFEGFFSNVGANNRIKLVIDTIKDASLNDKIDSDEKKLEFANLLVPILKDIETDIKKGKLVFEYIRNDEFCISYKTIITLEITESGKAKWTAGLFNALESQSKEMEFFHLEVKDDTKQEMKQDSKGMELD